MECRLKAVSCKVYVCHPGTVLKLVSLAAVSLCCLSLFSFFRDTIKKNESLCALFCCKKKEAIMILH